MNHSPRTPLQRILVFVSVKTLNTVDTATETNVTVV